MTTHCNADALAAFDAIDRPPARLRRPTNDGWVLAAVATRRRSALVLPFTHDQRSARATIRELFDVHNENPEILELVQLQAVLGAPGNPRDHGDRIGWDHVLLARTRDLASAQMIAEDLRKRPPKSLGAPALITAAVNVRRIADVPHTRRGAYLVNYFTGPDVNTTLAVWEYTARWFQDNTSLTNSTVLQPTTPTQYTIINHCQWKHWSLVVGSLALRRSFRTFVLNSFHRMRVQPHPILYRLVAHRRPGHPHGATNSGTSPTVRAPRSPYQETEIGTSVETSR